MTPGTSDAGGGQLENWLSSPAGNRHEGLPSLEIEEEPMKAAPREFYARSGRSKACLSVVGRVMTRV